jgi:hypothetical protein
MYNICESCTLPMMMTYGYAEIYSRQTSINKQSYGIGKQNSTQCCSNSELIFHESDSKNEIISNLSHAFY